MTSKSYDERLAELILDEDSAVHKAIVSVTTQKPAAAKTSAAKK